MTCTSRRNSGARFLVWRVLTRNSGFNKRYKGVPKTNTTDVSFVSFRLINYKVGTGFNSIAFGVSMVNFQEQYVKRGGEY